MKSNRAFVKLITQGMIPMVHHHISDRKLSKNLKETKEGLSSLDEIQYRATLDASRLELEGVKTLLNKAPLGYQLLDAKGTIQEVNQAWLDVLGYTRDEVIGKDFRTFLSLQWKNLCQDTLSWLTTNETTHGVQVEMLAKNGQTIRVVLYGHIIGNGHNTLEQIHGLLYLIPDKNNALEFQKILTSTLDAVDSLLMVIDKNHRIVLSNWKEHEWVPEADRLKNPYCYKVFKKLENPCPYCPPAKTFQDGQARWYEDQNPIDGSFKEISVIPIFNDHGQVEYVLENVRDVTKRKQAEEQLRQHDEKYKKLINTSPDAIALFDEEGQFLAVNVSMAKSLGIAQDELKGKYIHDFMSKEVATKRLKKGREAIEKGEVVFFEDEREGRFFENYYVPVAFSNEKRTFQGIAREITDIKQVRNDLQKTLNKLNQAFHGTIRILSSALEQRDAYTAGHQERVTRLACALAHQMGLEEDRLQGLYYAGMVHDIGKISVPTEILAKPTRLSDIEFGIIKQHVRSGYEILKDVDFPWPIANIVVQHHERCNGSGYPNGLSGDEILLEARILAVADVIEAMASHRPYRPALGIETALKEIETHKGTLYDPRIVDECLRLFREKHFSFDS